MALDASHSVVMEMKAASSAKKNVSHARPLRLEPPPARTSEVLGRRWLVCRFFYLPSPGRGSKVSCQELGLKVKFSLGELTSWQS